MTGVGRAANELRGHSQALPIEQSGFCGGREQGSIGTDPSIRPPRSANRVRGGVLRRGFLWVRLGGDEHGEEDENNGAVDHGAKGA